MLPKVVFSKTYITLRGMEMTIQESTLLVQRLRDAMDSRGITPKELARRANVGKSFVYDILSGKSLNPTTTRLSALSQVLNFPLSYFIPNTGSANSDYNYLNYDNYVSIRNITTDQDEPFIFFHNKAMKDLAENKQSLIAFTIEGDSMTDTLHDGDVVLVNKDKCLPYPSGLFLIEERVGITVKRLEYSGNALDKVSIISDNNKYKDYDIHIGDVKILGRVVWYGRKM